MGEREMSFSEHLKWDESHIIDSLHLNAATLEKDGLFVLHPNAELSRVEDKNGEGKLLESPRELAEYFENMRHVRPDTVCRPSGDATFFTTAGVQHVETIVRKQGEIQKQSFIIAQPSVRTQFMDKVREGTSTSFINFAAVSVKAEPAEYVALCKKFISLLISQGAKAEDLTFHLEKTGDTWGKRELKKSTLTFLHKNIELGEGVFIHDYPVTPEKKITIADISIGIERVRWALRKNKYYLPGFEKFYAKAKTEEDVDAITSAIDSVRTSVLIANEGLKPTHASPGRTLRQLSKRYVERAKNLNLKLNELIDCAYEYWLIWSPTQGGANKEEMQRTIFEERDRNFNVLIAAKLKEKGGPTIHLEAHQSTEHYLEALYSTCTQESTIRLVKEIVSEIT